MKTIEERTKRLNKLMRHFRILFICALLVSCGTAGTTTRYGNYRASGNNYSTTVYRDNMGRKLGTSTTMNGVTVYRDNMGRRVGTSTRR